MNTRVIVCAAIRNNKTGVVLCGVHHGRCKDQAMDLELLGRSEENTSWIPGFIDNDNNFLTRAEAWKVADAAGQIRRPTGWEKDYSQTRPAGVGDEGLLFSENLYKW